MIMNSQCKCTPDETTGWTTVKCCNICGKPVEDFWCVPELIDNKILSETVDLMRGIIDKFLNTEKPNYSEAELLVIKDSIDRHLCKQI